MSSVATKDSNLRQLFAKLGHSLEEIRVRSLQNILSKLEHSLICDADLVQEKHLHIRLLEWFNFSSCPHQDLVLGLILRLSQHPSAAAIYVDIGAVEFLNQLRSNVNPALYGTVDAILSNLFHLPSAESLPLQLECVYQPRGHSGGSYSTSHPLDDLTYGTELPSNLTDGSYFPGKSCPSPPDQMKGYFVKTPVDEIEAHGRLGSVRSEAVIHAKCFKFSTFPWIALTQTDKHVLASTDESVRSKDLSLVVSVCEFLSDVVFQDFPSEVFLQRPSIVKNLISLLSVHHLESSGVPLKALQSLIDLSSGLLTRINCCRDPAVYTSKQDFLLNGTDVSLHSPAGQSSDSSGSHYSFAERGEARHRGDGQDVDNSSSNSTPSVQAPGNVYADALEQLPFEEMCTMQLMQWTVPQFCMTVFDSALHCLRSNDERVIGRCLDLLQQIVALLQESLIPDELWIDESMPAREFVEKLHDCLDIATDLLYHHHHHNHLYDRHGAPAVSPVVVLHRIAFTGVSILVTQLLELLVPIGYASLAISSDYGSVLALIYQDKALSYCYPKLCETALRFARAIDEVNPELFDRAETICQSLTSTCTFLLKFDDLSDETVLDLVEIASETIPSLSFHQNMAVVRNCVHLASVVCKKTSPNPSAVSKIRELLIALLSYPLEEVRLNTYETIYDIVKDALGIERVAEPTSSAALAAMFIVDSKIFYEISCFGMNDAEKIAEIANRILLYLLQSQLLLTADRWKQITDAVVPVMSVLQGMSDHGTPLGKCVTGMIETDPRVQTGALSLPERLRGSLRLLFHKDERIRSDGVNRTLSLLSQEDGCIRKLPQFSDIDIRSMSDLFLIKSQRSLIATEVPASIFQEPDLKKVYDIFSSDSVEIDVRKSAAEQIAQMMQDFSLHKSFRKIADVSKLLDLLSLGVSLGQESKQWNLLAGMLPSVIKILRCLVESDLQLRHRLAVEPPVLYSVLRSVLLHRTDEFCRKEAAELFTFLLFEELSSFDNGSTDDGNQKQIQSIISLPSCLVERYNFPFKVAPHHSSSPWRVEIPPDSAPLRQGLLLEMMRISWAVAWHGNDVNIAIKSLLGNPEKKEPKSCSLEMTHIDGVMLSTSYLPYALRQCLFDMENATSHAAFSQSVLRISSYFVIGSSNDTVGRLFHSMKWKEAISKFLMVVPCSTEDELLLYDILHTLQLMLRLHKSSVSRETMDWLAEMLLNPRAGLQSLLAKSNSADVNLPEASALAKSQLNRALLKFVTEFIGHFPYNLSKPKSISRCVHGDLAKYILAKVNRADTAQSYNLSSLKLTLSCLMQITARPGWTIGCSSSDCLLLSLQTLQLLLEVVSAFHVGRGGMSMSYMGRGITRCTALCLRHLAHEMAKQLQSQDWPRNWLFTRHAMVNSVGESGLHWLFPLWSYRDSEVRAAGVGIAAALASTESGRITLTTQCHSIPGGIWAVAFSVLLDSSECSLVRQQAALLLVNLTSQSMPSGTVLPTTPDTVWQGPIVVNEETQTSEIGLSALLILLHHTEFYNKVCVMLNNVYRHPMIHAAGGAARNSDSTFLTTLDSQPTLTTSGSVTPVVSTGLLVDIGSLSQSGLSFIASNTAQDSMKSFNSVTNRQHLTAREETISGGVDSISNLSSSYSDILESRSVVTPSLASSICLMLSNLIVLEPKDTLGCIEKQGIFKALLKILNADLLGAYHLEFTESRSRHKSQWILAFQELVNLQRDAINLARICASHDAELCRQLLEDGSVLRQLVMMLGIACPADPDLNSCCQRLWEAVFNLLSSVLWTNSQEVFLLMCPVVVKHWKVIAGRVVNILEEKELWESELWRKSLTFVALVLAEETKLKVKLQDQRPDNVYFVTDRLDSPENKVDDGDVFSCSAGAVILCQALVNTFDVVILKPMEFFTTRAVTVNALKSLVAVSTSAKMAALEAGLLEILLEHIGRLQVKISAEMLDVIKAAKKKKNPVFLEMIMILELLRNFLFNNEDIKLCACRSGLSSLIHSIWMWCQMDLSLMSCVLALLSSYVAYCPQAASSLAFTSASTLVIPNQPKSQLKPVHSNNSLVHCLIKLMQKEASAGNQTILKQSFTLAATLSLSQECRGIFWKSNFIQDFSSLSPQKSKKTKTNVLWESLWLNLLLNLSFSSDGQNMIYKIDGGIPLLVEFAFDGVAGQQKSALLVVRNLCFNSANKPKLLTNERLISLFLHCIESDSSELKTIACSAVFTLLYNNQKAKGILKNAHVMMKLKDASDHLQSVGGEQTWAENCSRVLKDIFILLKV